MNIQKVTAVYFSPVGNVKKIASVITEQIYQEWKDDAISIEYIDFTLPEQRLEIRQFSDNELVVFAVPVYAGRIPNKVLPFVQTLFKGNGTPIVPVVTFGNRSYDNALKELCMELDRSGFLVVGAAAVVSEHSFSNKLASGRPNAEDIDALRRFAMNIAGKFSGDRGDVFLNLDKIPGDWPLVNYYTPLGMDGKPAVFLKAKPRTLYEVCENCGICASHCPMGSISKIDAKVVEGICIKCQACVKKCPRGAKYFDDEAFLSHVRMLEENYSRPSNNKILE